MDSNVSRQRPDLVLLEYRPKRDYVEFDLRRIEMRDEVANDDRDAAPLAEAPHDVHDTYRCGPICAGVCVRHVAVSSMRTMGGPTDRCLSDLALLKSPDYATFAIHNGGRLPYRIDTLVDSGFRLVFSDASHRRPWSRRWPMSLLGRLGPLGGPFLDTLVQWRAIRRAPLTLAMFESQGHVLAFARSFGPRRRNRRLVIIACWLADIAPRLSARKRAIYRRMYRAVDLVIVFSSNQTAILTRELGIPPERIMVVPFGIDTDEFVDVSIQETGTVVAVGRDAGRDWGTFLKAVDGTGWDVKVACRQRLLGDIPIPPEVEVLGYVDREHYRRLLANATVVVISTEERAYPTGQSVLLEAMAIGKPCVVTHTAAMADYAANGVNCLTVPVADAPALCAAIARLLDDPILRERIGAGGTATVTSTCNARAMWRTIGAAINDLDRGGNVS